MVERINGRFIVVCDNCGEAALDEDNDHQGCHTFQEAVELAVRLGWSRARLCEQWFNYCPDCARGM